MYDEAAVYRRRRNRKKRCGKYRFRCVGSASEGMQETIKKSFHIHDFQRGVPNEKFEKSEGKIYDQILDGIVRRRSIKGDSC